MNLPNKLTLSRLIVVPIYTAIMLSPIERTTKSIIAVVLFVLTALTDFLDGYIARKYKLVTDFGRFLDPVADKVMVFGGLCGLIYMNIGNSALTICLISSTFIFFLREILVTTLRMIVSNKSNKVISAAFVGKLKTVSQIAFIVIALLEPVIFGKLIKLDTHLVLTYIFLAFMTLMTVISGVSYFKQYYPLIDSKK